MTDKLKKVIEDEVVKLPIEAQNAINSLDWETIAEEIGRKFSLLEEETSDLQVETLLVLTGLSDYELFAQKIENYVGTTKEEAEKISKEIEEKIFIPIANILSENIRKNIKDKNPDWKQSMNFVLSGGDYSAFLDTREDEDRV